MRLFILFVVSLFCLTCLFGCQNNAPVDQLTVVQGTVISAQTGKPLRGVLMGIESYTWGFSQVLSDFTGDSVRTDAQGKYRIQFYNKKAGYYYAISLEPYISGSRYQSRYTFSGQSGGGLRPNQRDISVGKASTVDFKPIELRTLAIRIRNRNTGYQKMEFNYRFIRGNNLDSTAYLTGFYFENKNISFRYFKLSPTGAFLKDTSVAAVILNPAALPPDTLRATLTFVR